MAIPNFLTSKKFANELGTHRVTAPGITNRVGAIIRRRHAKPLESQHVESKLLLLPALGPHTGRFELMVWIYVSPSESPMGRKVVY